WTTAATSTGSISKKFRDAKKKAEPPGSAFFVLRCLLGRRLALRQAILRLLRRTRRGLRRGRRRHRRLRGDAFAIDQDLDAAVFRAALRRAVVVGRRA